MKSFRQFCAENYRAMRNPEKYKPDDELLNHTRKDQEQTG